MDFRGGRILLSGLCSEAEIAHVIGDAFLFLMESYIKSSPASPPPSRTPQAPGTAWRSCRTRRTSSSGGRR